MKWSDFKAEVEEQLRALGLDETVEIRHATYGISDDNGADTVEVSLLPSGRICIADGAQEEGLPDDAD